MKRILLFLLLFCFFGCGILFAGPGQGPEKIVVAPLVNFDQVFITLRQILIQLFFKYYHLVLGFVAVMLLLSYFQGMLEDRQMRRVRERQEREYRRDYRERSEMHRVEKQLARERELIQKYAHVNGEESKRVQWEMYQEMKDDTSGDELRLAPRDPNDLPIDDDVFKFSGRVQSEEYMNKNMRFDQGSWGLGGRGTTYWRADGSEEGSESFFEDTQTIGGSSTVEIRRDKHRNRFHRGMDEDDEGGGY